MDPSELPKGASKRVPSLRTGKGSAIGDTPAPGFPASQVTPESLVRLVEVDNIAVQPHNLACRFHQFDILPHALAPVGRTVRHCELQPFEAELNVLLHVVAGAVRRDSWLCFAAQQLVD